MMIGPSEVVYREKRRGPKTEPCGTPVEGWRGSDRDAHVLIGGDFSETPDDALDQWFSNFLDPVPPQKIFDSPSTTFMTNVNIQ